MEADPSLAEPVAAEASTHQGGTPSAGAEQGAGVVEPQGIKAGVQPVGVSAPSGAAAGLGAGGTVTEGPRVEVSAATVTRMMGIATAADLRLLEGRMDLLASKVTGLLTKVDRVLSMFNSVPTSSDIGRLEIQVGALKSMLRDLLDVSDSANSEKRQAESKEASEEQGRKLRDGIRSSSE